MGFLTAYHTDIGIRKKTNQDALLLKSGKTAKGSVGLFVVCDGMGGLSQGELASATVIRGLSDWFETEMPLLALKENKDEEIFNNIHAKIVELNEKILDYGTTKQVKLGTTLTALLVMYSKYYIFHVGDSRAYQMTNELVQLTKDQTFVAREVERGNMTEEQAKQDPRQNILLQCVGAMKELEVECSTGEITEDTVFMLCSDGFYHQIRNEELYEQLNPKAVIDEEYLQQKLIQCVELVKRRQEVDNISILAVKVL